MSCTCDFSLSNTGTPSCAPVMGVMKKLVLVPLVANDGTSNFIDLTLTLNQAYFNGKINHLDSSKRWYPTPEIKNITSEKAESVFETFEDASKVFIRQGIRSFTGIMPKQSPTLLGKLESFRCAEFGVFIIDKDGNIIGSLKEAGKLYPIAVDAASWNPIMLFGNDTTIQKIQLTFDFSIDELDKNLNMITSSEITPVNVLAFEGLLDVNAVYTAPSTTSFVATLTTDYGTAKTKQPVKGFVLADFTLFNVTDALSVSITSVTEGAAGVYTIVYPAQGSAEVLRLSGVKTGYDLSKIDDTTILIP